MVIPNLEEMVEAIEDEELLKGGISLVEYLHYKLIEQGIKDEDSRLRIIDRGFREDFSELR